MVYGGNETHYNMGTADIHPMENSIDLENAIDELIEAFSAYRDIRVNLSVDEWLESLKADPELNALVDAINALTDLVYPYLE